ncbi:MAG: DUF2877 domain-containing protein [Actinomycetaceae bacterium]|nr:DUF2877 domain-containing protein [Actinomycetaceae bacterium]
MIYTQALTVDSLWQSLITQQRELGRKSPPKMLTVVNSFDRALNLECASLGKHVLLSVTVSSLLPAPGALSCGLHSLPRMKSGDTVELFGDELRTGLFCISLRNYQVLDLSVEALGGDAFGRMDTERVVFLTRTCERFKPSVSKNDQSNPSLDIVNLKLTQSTAKYVNSLVPFVVNDCNRDEYLKGAVQGLVGLGLGLTPSGDDFLVGSLAVLHLAGPFSDLMAIVSEAINSQLEQTTVVSRHFLHFAVEGFFHSSVFKAAQAALVGTKDDVVTAFTELSTLGSSSGYDTLMGIVETVKVVHQHKI